MEKEMQVAVEGKPRRNELCRLLQVAVKSQNSGLAESLILSADPKTLNDALYISLELIWFLTTQQELDIVMGLIQKMIANGSCDLKRAVSWASFTGSLLSGFQNLTMSMIADVTLWMTQRFCEFVEGGGQWKGQDDFLMFIQSTGCSFGNRQDNKHGLHTSSDIEIKLQLPAFRTFLDLASSQLTSNDFVEAFDVACFPMMFVSNTFDHDCEAGNWEATVVPGLLRMLVERGTDGEIVNNYLIKASLTGYTELVHILLEVAQMNNLRIDVDEAFSFACSSSKIATMECLVKKGHAKPSEEHLYRAAARGCKPVVEWFIEWGCEDMELCFALAAATSRSQVDVAAYLLPQLPRCFLPLLFVGVVKHCVRQSESLGGLALLFRSDFLGRPDSTYSFADAISCSYDNGSVAPEVRVFLKEHWSEEAFLNGLRQGEEHYMNVVRILRWGESPICLDRLDPDLRVAIAYLPLYKECVKEGGCLLSQRLRGQLVDAVKRLGGGNLDGMNQCPELLAVLKHRLQSLLN